MLTSHVDYSAKCLRRKQGRPQDLALEVAAKLGRIHTEAQLYELSPRLRVNLTIPHAVTMEREACKGEAAEQLTTICLSLYGTIAAEVSSDP